MIWKCKFCELEFRNPGPLLEHEYYAHMYRSG